MMSKATILTALLLLSDRKRRICVLNQSALAPNHAPKLQGRSEWNKDIPLSALLWFGMAFDLLL